MTEQTSRVPKIRHTYWRDYTYNRREGSRPSPKGGISVTYRIESADDEQIIVRAGFAFCSPRDCFVRAKGREASLLRFTFSPVGYIFDTKAVFDGDDFNIVDVEWALRDALRQIVESNPSLWPRHVVRFLRGE